MTLRVPPVVFDKKQGRFWRQGKHDPVIGYSGLMRDIQALQVCSAKITDFEGGTYWSYELDAVLKGPACRRFSVVRRDDRDMIFEDARKLAEFLAVPMLDHTDEESAHVSPAFKRTMAWLLKK
jgi:hypothetical protein